MNTSTPYTRVEAMQALGITSSTAFHHLRRSYPQAFIVVNQGTGKDNPTLYDRQVLDKFIQWRNSRKAYQS
jgi:hypothetical protein